MQKTTTTDGSKMNVIINPLMQREVDVQIRHDHPPTNVGRNNRSLICEDGEEIHHMRRCRLHLSEVTHEGEDGRGCRWI